MLDAAATDSKATTTTSTRRNELIVIQELGLALRDQSNQVKGGRVRTRRNGIGEDSRGGRRSTRSARGRGTVSVGAQAGATPGSDGLICVVRFSGGWPAVHECSAAVFVVKDKQGHGYSKERRSEEPSGEQAGRSSKSHSRPCTLHSFYVVRCLLAKQFPEEVF